MRIHAVAVIVLASGLLVAADAPPQDAGKKELAKVQGTWMAISAEADGQKAPDEAIKGFKVVVKGNKMAFNPETEKRESIFELDPTKRPKEIIVTPFDGPRKGKSQRGLYSVEKEFLTLCLNNDPNSKTDKPPTTFATKQRDGLRVLVLKRQKP